jgi:hypothetical protein
VPAPACMCSRSTVVLLRFITLPEPPLRMDGITTGVCACRFAEGAAQFRLDVSVNPNDTEEAIWAFACEARTLGFAEARKGLLPVGRDSRAYMCAAYK